MSRLNHTPHSGFRSLTKRRPRHRGTAGRSLLPVGPALGTAALSLALVYGSVPNYDVPVESVPIMLTSGEGDDGGGGSDGGSNDGGGSGGGATSGGGTNGGATSGGGTNGGATSGGENEGAGADDGAGSGNGDGELGSGNTGGDETGSLPGDGTGGGSLPGDGTGSGSLPGDGAGTGSLPGDGAGTGSLPGDGAGTGSLPGDGAGAGTPAPTVSGETGTGGAPATGSAGAGSGPQGAAGIGTDANVIENFQVDPNADVGPFTSILPEGKVATTESVVIEDTEDNGPLGGVFRMINGLFGGGASSGGASGAENNGPLKGFADLVGGFFGHGADNGGENKGPVEGFADLVGGFFGGAATGGGGQGPLNGVADFVGGIFGGGDSAATPVGENPARGITDFVGGLFNGGKPLDFTLFNRGFGLAGAPLSFDNPSTPTTVDRETGEVTGEENYAYALIPQGTTGLQAALDILGLLGATFTQGDEMCTASAECKARLADTRARQGQMPSWEESGYSPEFGAFIDERDLGLVQSDYFSESFGSTPFQTAVEMIAGGPVPGLGILSALDSFLSQEDQSWDFTKGTPLRTFIQEEDTRGDYVDNIVWTLQGIVGLFIPVV